MLADRDEPLVATLPRRPGSRPTASRTCSPGPSRMSLVAEPADARERRADLPPVSDFAALEARVAALEAEVAALRDALGG